MTSTAVTTFPRMLKTLRENSSVKEKREALTYITSQAKKLESTGIIKEEQYKELCKLVVEIFAKEDGNMHYEALEALHIIVQEFRAHPLHLFETLLQKNKRTRLKVLKLLEIVEDNVISAIANDGQVWNFFKDCMDSVQPDAMEWIAPTACVEDLQMLINVEYQVLSYEQKLEEDTIIYSLALLKRLYKLATISEQSMQRFDTLLMDKVMALAYLGYKRQRGPALQVLQQVVATNLSLRIRKDCPDLWTQYKVNLQSVYCKRMSLLVAACEPDWSNQWNITIQFLGTDLHRGAILINNLLSVEEKAFKSTDTIIRRQAFLSWKLLIDNFALDHQELATVRRIKLLCIPLNAKNSKTELIAVTKLEVWWHLIIKLYKDIVKFVTPVITQFLNFCFGPLGDTPLLSSKFDVIASPGKRFLKTKVVAVAALYQLLVTKEENLVVYSPLEEKLPHAISHAVFQECSKSIIHSIGEALLILSQLTDQEMQNRHQLGKILWISLMTYIKDSKLETKGLLKNVILIVIELVNHMDKPMLKNMMLDVILSDITYIIKNSEFNDHVLPELLLKLLSSPILGEMSKNNYDAVKCLLQHCICPEIMYSTGVLGFLGTIMENLELLKDTYKKTIDFTKLWCIIAEILTKYITDFKKIDDDNKKENSFQTVKSVLFFPFRYTPLESFKQDQMENYIMIWKTLYKQFELQSDLISTVKPNEIVLDTASVMRDYLNINKSCSFIANCLDVLLSTVNYESLLAQNEIPSIMLLIVDVITISFNNVQDLNCEIALRILSAILITVYGHNSQKVVSYLYSCISVIELMLSSQIRALSKEITSTWETIISIFKGFNKQLNYELLSSYKEAIIRAMEHPNSEIQSLAQSIFEIKNDFDSSTRHILNEIEKQVSHSRSNETAGKEKEKTGKVKEIHKDNKKSPKITRSTLNKSYETNDKKKSILSEPDSQDYVHIKTDLKFDVNRLTEHQKETLKKKREDIPALYNDLSQSSSQNSQNLQEWFDIKAKHINESDKANNKKSDSTSQKPVDNDANKENKIAIMQSELSVTDKVVSNNNSSKLDENVGENIVDMNQDENLKKETEKGSFNEKDENKNTLRRTNLTSHVTSSSKQSTVSETDKETNVENSIISVAKRLNFDSREEFPEDETYKQRLSPSMLDSSKRRCHNSITRSSSLLRGGEVEKDSSATNIQRTLKLNQEKSSTNNKQKMENDIEIKENSNEIKRGIKHKHMSETYEGTLQRKRRLNTSSTSSNDEDNDKSQDNDNLFRDTAHMENPRQRMKNEISRLKIDMVFNCLSVNRRRVKYADEHDKEAALKKYAGSDNKGLKLKSTDAKSTEGFKRSPKKTEKDGKDTKDLSQAVFIRRSKRRKESNKNDSDITISDNNTDKIHESNILIDTDMSATHVILTPNQTVQDVTRVPDAKLKNTESLENTESNKQNHDEVEDVVESSQTPSKLGKKCGDKQCFIKINKITNINITKTVEKNCVPESSPMDCGDNNVPDPCEKIDEANPNNYINVSEANKNNISKDSVQETDNSNMKTIISEGQKSVDISTKPTSIINFSSPKSGSKVLSKLKPFASHGRAAHMLGLVTRQSQIESDSPSVVPEDELLIKRLRSKDIEIETSSGKKIKELDKIGGSSGSRQEKIFSNMKLNDYSISLSTNMSPSLKNDGENLPSKIDQSAPECLMTENTVDKKNDGNMSPSREMDDLPILEWSNANPPSINASPSVSILKRHRTTLEADADSITSNKRKRVSFADPPVSKEMGYEISVTGTPHTPNKYSMVFIPRNLMMKKDSPLRCKQTRLKFISIDSEKTTNNNIQNEDDIEVVSQKEKENESLTKSNESCTKAMDIDVQIPCDSVQDNKFVETNIHTSCTIDDLAQESKISEDLSVPNVIQDQQIFSSEVPDMILQNSVNIVSVENVKTEESETQQDIFDGTDTKDNITPICTNNNNIDISTRNNSANPLNLHVTNDSVIAALSTTKDDNLTNLEDTVDVQNITELNCSMISDEIFCNRLVRSSTRATENIAEQDTLPATDSVFSSLPLTQDSQSDNQRNIESDPQFLDSIQPIYPALSSCQEPIDAIVAQLTNPLWKQNLCSYLINRNLRTIGDLAQLSEREINRMPVKGKSKIEFVKTVLQRFENTCTLQTKPSENSEQSSAVAENEAAILPATTIPDVEKASTAIGNESLTCSTPLSQSIEKDLNDLSAKKLSTCDKTESITSDICSTDILSEPIYSTNLQLSVLDNSPLDGSTCMNAKELITSQSLPGTSTNKLGPTLIFPAIANMMAVSALPSTASMDTSEVPSPRICDESFISYSSVGINTDDSYSSKSTVKTATRSVESQMALEELLDKIDVNLVLDNAIKRCSPEAILSQYKIKLGHLSKAELVKETIRMLGLQNKQQLNDTSLKGICRATGVNKVLLRLPDIFGSDKQFFDKVLKVYNKKLKIADCLNAFDFTQLKNAMCQKCTSSELMEMLSNKLKQEEQEGIKQPMPEISSLNAMLQRLPMDVVISHTVANEELIPASLVLDIALQNNSSKDIAQALQAQSSDMVKCVLDNLWTSQFTVAHIENEDISKDSLLNIFKSVCSKLSAQELLDVYHETMANKLIKEERK